MHIDPNERKSFLFVAGLLVIFFLAVTIGASASGISLPAPELRVDPRTVATDPNSPFSAPVEDRLRKLADGKYEVYILAQTWSFIPGSAPNPIVIPVGSSVTFYVTSKDIIHGFRLDDTNLSFMVIPGQVSKLTATFDKVGTFNFVCHEYCGVAHHTMFGELIVEE